MGNGDKAGKFLRGAAILSIAGLLSKFIGSIYRVILTRLMGAEGIGLFELAYPVYVTLLTVSRSGIPVALAQLVARSQATDKEDEHLRIFRTARFLSVLIGLFFTLAMIFGSKGLIRILGWDPRALPSLLAIAPAIFFVSIMAAYRGYFQGFQRMGPTGVSQVVEQAVRMVTMLILVILLLPMGVEYAAGGATFGAVTGAVAGLGVMLYFFRKSGHAPHGLGIPRQQEVRDRGPKIARVALPVTFGALVFPLMRLVDAVIIPSRLQVAGWSITEATPLYGTLASALVLVNFPTILTVALAASLVPAIAHVHERGNREELSGRINTALRVSVIVGLPAAVGLFVMAEPLSKIIFDLPEAAVPLVIVSWGVLFMGVQQTTSGILQGAGLVRWPAVNLFWGAALNGVINFFLTAQPYWGIRGAALGTTMGFALAAILNLFVLVRKLKPTLSFNIIFPAMGAALGMGLLINPILHLWQQVLQVPPDVVEGFMYVLAVLLTVVCGALIFFLLLLFAGGVTEDEIRAIPRHGDRWAEVYNRLRKGRR